MLSLVDAAIGGDDAAALRYTLVRGRTIVEQGYCEVDDLRRVPASQAAIAFLSRTSVFARAELKAPANKPRLLSLQARRFIDAEMVFNEPYRLRLQVAARGEGITTTETAAVVESLFGDIERVFPRDAMPITRLSPSELAIAALVRQVTQAPALLFWARGNLGIALLVENGVVRSRQVEAMRARDSEIEMGDWIDFVNRADDSLRNAARHLIPNQDVYLRLYLGDFHEMFTFDVRAETRAPGHVEQDRASEALEQKLATLLPCAGECTGQDLLGAPELYGLLFVDAVWNWLPEDYQDRVDFHRWARPAAAVAGVAALALAGYDARRWQATGSGEAEAARRAALAAETQKWTARMPSANEAASIEKQIGLAASTEQEMRLDRFLPWVTRSMAAGVAIRKLHIGSSARAAGEPKRDSQASATPAGADASPGERGRYEVSIELESHGSYEETQHSMATTLRQLAQRLHIEDSSFRYGPRKEAEDAEAVGMLTARLIANGKDFR